MWFSSATQLYFACLFFFKNNQLGKTGNSEQKTMNPSLRGLLSLLTVMTAADVC